MVMPPSSSTPLRPPAFSSKGRSARLALLKHLRHVADVIEEAGLLIVLARFDPVPDRGLERHKAVGTIFSQPSSFSIVSVTASARCSTGPNICRLPGRE